VVFRETGQLLLVTVVAVAVAYESSAEVGSLVLLVLAPTLGVSLPGWEHGNGEDLRLHSESLVNRKWIVDLLCDTTQCGLR